MMNLQWIMESLNLRMLSLPSGPLTKPDPTNFIIYRGQHNNFWRISALEPSSEWGWRSFVPFSGTCLSIWRKII
jgi:hypothetical protein